MCVTLNWQGKYKLIQYIIYLKCLPWWHLFHDMVKERNKQGPTVIFFRESWGVFSLCRCLEAVLETLGSVPRSEPRSIAFGYHALNTVSALFLICLNSFSVSAIMLYALTMSLDFFWSLMLTGLMTVRVFMPIINEMRNWNEQHVW